MPMDFKFIQRLAQLMQQNELTELELDDPKSGARLRLERGGKAPPPSASPVVHVTHAGGVAPPPSPVAAAAEPVPAAPAGPPPGTKTINSPMVGTFYRSPSPEAESFVQAGASIKADTVICIIEAMKVMNEIRAEVAGTVLEVLVENGQPVEFGQPLFLIRPA